MLALSPSNFLSLCCRLHERDMGPNGQPPPFVVVLSVQHILHCVPGFRPRGTNLERDILFVIQCTNRCSPPLSSLCSNSEGQYAPWTKNKYHINVIVARSAVPHNDIPHPRPSIIDFSVSIGVPY